MANLKNSLNKRVDKISDKSADNDSSSTYRRGIRQFADFMKEEYKINKIKLIFGKEKEYVQAFERHLEDRGLSASTIHTYLQPVCEALRVKMQDIDKPKRIDVTKGRNPEANAQGKREEKMEKFQPSVKMGMATGYRRRELKKMKIGALGVDENGFPSIKVKGKGGKIQYQRLLPEDVEYVKSVFDHAYQSYASGASVMTHEQILEQPLFSEEQFKNKINYHKFRRMFGQRAYDFYGNRVASDKEHVKKELVERWNAHHSDCPKPDKYGNKRYNEKIIINMDGTYSQADSRSVASRAFLETINGDTYVLRGSNRDKALRLGSPISYDKLTLTCVSVYELAHWRNNVTVKHYMLD